jgi:citrate lyase beta subunit
MAVAAETNQRMRDTFTKLSRHELRALQVWVRVRDKQRSQEKSRTLAMIETALEDVALPP